MIKKVYCKTKKILFNTLISMSIFSLMMLLIFFLSPLEVNKFVGESMTGDDRPNFINYSWSSKNLKIDRSDVIIFNVSDAGVDDYFNKMKSYQMTEDTSFVKRVIALEGEVVKISKGKMYINDEELEENYIINNYSGEDIPEVFVPKDHVFIAGDYRYNSLDSRTFGPILRDSITSKVIIYNNKYINKMTGLMHRLLVYLDIE